MLATTDFKGRDFPGGHPAGMMYKHLRQLQDYPYKISIKADGTRYLLYIAQDFGRVFFVTRTMEVYAAKQSIVPEGITGDCILDGELVHLHDGTLRWITFDAILVNGKLVMNDNLSARLAAAEGVLETAPNLLANVPTTMQDFHDYKLLADLPALQKSTFLTWLTSEMSGLPYDTDGLVFTPVGRPYAMGFARDILKWKDITKLTIDFLLQPSSVMPGVFELRVSQKGKLIVFDFISPTGDQNLNDYSRKIVECGFDPTSQRYTPEGPMSGNWVIHRVREDKKQPNAGNTFC